MSFDEIARLVRERHGVVLTQGRRAETGETGDGAWFAVDGSGAAVVVKWVDPAAVSRFELLAMALDVARERGVPVPVYRPPLPVPGFCVLVQDVVVGSAGRLTEPLVADVHAAVSLLADIPAPHHRRGPWGMTMVQSLREGLVGWCEHGALLAAGGAPASLVHHARAVGEDLSPDMFPTGDLMHMDLHAGNVLHDDAGRLAAVIDWESACAGDFRFDLAYFAFSVDASEGGITTGIWQAVEEATPPEVLRAYAAHMVLRMVDWSLRYHDAAAVERWRRAGDRLLSRYP